jgi:hypothetical protein
MHLWEEELTEEEAQNLIDKIVEQVLRRRMETPAIMMLEMHKPLATLAGNTAVAFSPFLVPFLGFQNVNDYSRLFAKREYWDRLIDAIEEGAKRGPGKEQTA